MAHGERHPHSGDWRDESLERSARKARRRANLWLLLVALAVIAAATAAFVVPMLVTS